MLRLDSTLGLAVVDLAKDPNASGSLATSTTLKSRIDEALASGIGNAGSNGQLVFKRFDHPQSELLIGSRHPFYVVSLGEGNGPTSFSVPLVEVRDGIPEILE